MIKISVLLDKQEAQQVSDALKARDIEYFILSNGNAQTYNDPYYHISVHAGDYYLTRRIVSSVLKQSLIENQKCPKCKYDGYTIVPKKNWFERLYHLGTTSVQGRKFKTRFII